MTRLSPLMAMAATLAAASAQTSGDWTIDENQAQGTLTISHATLGTLLRGVRLNVLEGSRLRRLEHWASSLSNRARISWTFWPEEYMIASWPTIPDWVLSMLF